MSKKTRAIFIGDVRFDVCHVFELDEETEEFVMLSDKDYFPYQECIKCPKDIVLEDKESWFVFEVIKENSDDLDLEAEVKFLK